MSTYIAPNAMAAQRGSRATAGHASVDDRCEACGADVFACTCEPVEPETFTADDVRAAIAESDRKRAQAISAQRTTAGALKDALAEVARLKGELAARPTIVAQAAPRVGDRPAGLVAYLARLVDPPRVAYAHALADELDGLGVVPADVLAAAQGAAWFADVDGKVRRRAHATR